MLHRRLLVPLAVVPLAVGGLLTGTASAAPDAAAAGPLSYSVEDAAPAALAAPDVAIVRGQWSRASLATHRTAGTARCSAANAGFTVTNQTAVAQAIRVNGKAFARVPAKGRAFVCGRSTRAFSATFVLARTGDRLPVRFR